MLDIQGVSKTFNPGTINEKIALRDVSLHLEDGDFVTVIGGNGAGKSTLLNTVAGTYFPDVGTITIGGVDISRIGRGYLRKNVAIVLQEPFLFSRTIRENIGITAQERDRDAMLEYVRAAARSACVDEAIEGFAQGYETVVGERGVTLSGGQKQRVAIARAMANDPAIILADEPTGALDSRTSREVLDFLQKLNDEGNTIVLITHDNSIAQEAKRVVRVADGKIIFDGPAREAFPRGD